MKWQARQAVNSASATFTLAEDTLDPSVAVDTPSAVGLSVRVSWVGVDIGSGVRNYDVQVKEGSAFQIFDLRFTTCPLWALSIHNLKSKIVNRQ